MSWETRERRDDKNITARQVHTSSKAMLRREIPRGSRHLARSGRDNGNASWRVPARRRRAAVKRARGEEEEGRDRCRRRSACRWIARRNRESLRGCPIYREQENRREKNGGCSARSRLSRVLLCRSSFKTWTRSVGRSVGRWDGRTDGPYSTSRRYWVAKNHPSHSLPLEAFRRRRSRDEPDGSWIVI